MHFFFHLMHVRYRKSKRKNQQETFWVSRKLKMKKNNQKKHTAVVENAPTVMNLVSQLTDVLVNAFT